jgi:hypothetical protein
MMPVWSDEDIYFYYLGVEHSEYPGRIWNRIKSENEDCASLLDIGSGPGAFSLNALSDGYDVQAVDVCEKHLSVLKGKALHKDKLCTYNCDWLEAPVQKADVSICAYSLSGSIKSLDGIAKVINNTKNAAYFISFNDIEKTDFKTANLLKESGVEPGQYSDSNKGFIDALKYVNGDVKVEKIIYDFGVPYLESIPIDKYAEFISRKSGLSDISLIIKHIENIMRWRDGKLWIPNPKESILITWRKYDE